MIRLLALVQKPEGISPGQRFRLEQWAPHLRARHGISLEFAAFESPGLTRVLYEDGHVPEKAGRVVFDFVRRGLHVARSRRYDGVVLYREAALLGPALYERLLARAGVPTILDFDDAIWLESGGGRNGIFAKLRFPAKTAKLCELADAVTVGNAYLADWARSFNSNVHVVRTSIELARYPRIEPPPDDGVLRIGWTGSLSTMNQHLEPARTILERVAARRPVEVQVVCSEPPVRPFAGARNVFIPWRAATEAEDVARCHVGIMPLPDDPFARGKCGCKALQYMAVGRPVVVSPVGVNTEIVRSGENGLLAESEDEWVEALLRLGDSPELRARLGAAGRATVEAGYSAESAAAAFAAAVYSAVRSGAPERAKGRAD